MVKVKIIFICTYSGGYECSPIDLKVDDTDWEEVTQEEYEALSSCNYEISQLGSSIPGPSGYMYPEKAILLRQDTIPIKQRISELKEIAAKKKIAADAKKQKDIERTKKAEKTRLDRELKRKKRLLEQLKSELEGNGKNSSSK